MSGAAGAGEPDTGSWLDLIRGRRGVYTLLLNLGILFFAIDNFLINTLMPSIVADIGGVAFYTWGMMLYVVGAIIGSGSYGPLRSRLGGRRALTLGGGVFSLGALGCSLAPDMAVLLVARLFQGTGGGVILAGSMAFISTLYEPALRRRAIALSSLTWIIAAVLGPLQGGIFGEIGWWRGAFMVYVPIGAAFLAGVWWRIPETADQATAASKALRFPLWRVSLLGLGVFCVALSGQAGSSLPRLALIAAAAVIVWYAFARDAGAENPLFPSRPLSLTEPVGLSYWGHILVTSAYIAVAIYLPLVLTVQHGVAPLYVGVANGIVSLGWSISAALVAGLHGKRERVVVIAGPLCLMTGSIGLGLVTTFGGHLAWLMLSAVLVGIGVGIFHVHMTARAMMVARPGEESITASSVPTIRSLGMAFGAAIAGTLANIVGLQQVATAEAVRGAVSLVWLYNAIPLTLAVLVLLRFFRVAGRLTKPGT